MQDKIRQAGRTVRRAARVARALGGLTLKRSPKWARVLAVACLAIPGPVDELIVCLAIPGPVDELIVWPLLGLYVAVRYRAEFASVARSTWKGETA